MSFLFKNPYACSQMLHACSISFKNYLTLKTYNDAQRMLQNAYTEAVLAAQRATESLK